MEKEGGSRDAPIRRGSLSPRQYGLRGDVGMSAVIVVGGGPVGLTLAYGLAKRGVEVTLLDKAPTVSDAPRAMAYIYFVHQGFQNLGVLDDLKAEALLGDGINFIDWDSGENFHMTLDPIENDVPFPFVLHMGQNQVGRILLRRLEELSNAQIRYNAEVVNLTATSDAVTVTISTPSGEENLTADWIVGTDGASSVVRKLGGFTFDGYTWPDRFISTNIRADLSSAGLRSANWRIDPVYGAVLARINKDILWRYTFREDGDLPDDSLEDRIHEHFAVGMPGHVDYELMQFQPYRMHQRAAETFRKGRVLLAGDAAHVTNPIGGLGLTGGFCDAFVLSEALAAVIHGTASDDVLDRYSDERRHVFLDMVSPAATANKKVLFDPHPPEEKAQLLAGLRFMATDREARRQDLLQAMALYTPTVL